MNDAIRLPGFRLLSTQPLNDALNSNSSRRSAQQKIRRSPYMMYHVVQDKLSIEEVSIPSVLAQEV
jgi:hypothetical protein